MNKSLLLLLPSLAAAGLLSGCRVYLPGESPRRTVFVNTGTKGRTADVPAARVSDAGAPDHSTPSSDRIAPQPVASSPVAPQPVASSPVAPAASAAPAPVLPPTAGADSYRNYMGGGASAASPAPRAPAPPAAAAVPAAPRSPAATSISEGSYRMYTVQPGDSAGMIANANGMTLAEFAKLNNLSDPNKLRVGQTVKIATGRSALAAGPAAQPSRTAAATVVPAGCVVVRDGDTLSAIAARHGTTVKALMEANGLSDANAIRAGRQLRLPGTAAEAPVQNVVHPIPTTTRPVATIPTTTRPVATIPATTRAPSRVTPAEASAAPGSTVTAGDATVDVETALSGGGLGAARQRTQDAARQVRDAAQAAGDQVQSAVGQVSDAAGHAAGAVRAAAAGAREYVVKEGDDIYSIAMQFDSQPLQIRALNGGKSLDDIRPGDTILVPAN